MKKELSSVLGIYNVSQKDRRSTCSALLYPTPIFHCLVFLLSEILLFSLICLCHHRRLPQWMNTMIIYLLRDSSWTHSVPPPQIISYHVLIQWKTPLSSYLFSLIPSQNMEVLLNHLSLFPPLQWGHYKAFRDLPDLSLPSLLPSLPLFCPSFSLFRLL